MLLISPIWLLGVQKERMEPEDLYVMSGNGSILYSPSPEPYSHKFPICSDCAPLFMKAHEIHNAGAVIHSHGMESCLVTIINPCQKNFMFGDGQPSWWPYLWTWISWHFHLQNVITISLMLPSSLINWA